jgi:D-alanyl-D-alanine carboxypeptidase (penicillin-binding protein 5/6)
VALDWCSLDEEVKIGNEVKLIARDSTRAYLAPGEVLTVRNLLEGMLLPSGNDAAYATAAYVGKKSLNREGADREEAVKEFVRLMNEKAKQLGVKNSCFKSPDGYDAIGQYTTAYDMGLIGLAAVQNETIQEICKKSSSRNIFPSGEDVTWNNTNSLIRQYSGRYYSPCIGLKTGTSTMAGRCLIAAGRKNGKEVVCVIMNSSSTGRWSDAIALMDYGLN